mmetsp:Transcript_33073/g.95080  ORF Transcript_33073/g.95080 Transcript_33073/m.95080 type:complete len:295 (-) Transcript_33073:1160-2044(-)
MQGLQAVGQGVAQAVVGAWPAACTWRPGLALLPRGRRRVHEADEAPSELVPPRGLRDSPTAAGDQSDAAQGRGHQHLSVLLARAVPHHALGGLQGHGQGSRQSPRGNLRRGVCRALGQHRQRLQRRGPDVTAAHPTAAISGDRRTGHACSTALAGAGIGRHVVPDIHSDNQLSAPKGRTCDKDILPTHYRLDETPVLRGLPDGHPAERAARARRSHTSGLTAGSWAATLQGPQGPVGSCRHGERRRSALAQGRRGHSPGTALMERARCGGCSSWITAALDDLQELTDHVSPSAQ